MDFDNWKLQPPADAFTLRDQFACAALTGLLAANYHSLSIAPGLAYDYADAMIVARSLKKETQP